MRAQKFARTAFGLLITHGSNGGDRGEGERNLVLASIVAIEGGDAEGLQWSMYTRLPQTFFIYPTLPDSIVEA